MIIIKTDQETTLSHHIETIRRIQIDKIKTIEAVHQKTSITIQSSTIYSETTPREFQ